MATPHITAEPNDFAKVVLMPGDSYRARWIAETFLHDIKLVTEVRGIFGYTGYTENGKRISVMASGMGMPSIGIYSHELFEGWGVEAIIRVGTCGSYREDIEVRDIIIAEGACTNSSWTESCLDLFSGTYSAIADFELLRDAVDIAKDMGLRYHVGNILSSDTFYEENTDSWRKWYRLGILGVEMEAFALFVNAALFKKKALAICTVTDSYQNKGTKLTAEQRQEGLIEMAKLGVALAEKYAD